MRHRITREGREANWTRALATLAACAWLMASVPAGGQSGGEPRPISETERQGVALALVYLEQGPAGWWDALAADAPLRELGRETALAEIGVRAGPSTGATWTLQTTAPRYSEGTVVFTVSFPSGLADAIFLDLVEEPGGWKIAELRCTADPTSIRKGPSALFWEAEEAESSHVPGGFAPATGGPGVGTWLAAFALLVTTVLFVRARPRHRAAVAGAVLVAMALAVGCQKGEAPVEEVAEVLPPSLLGELLPLREALAGVGEADHQELFKALPKTGTVAEVGRLWEAQYLTGQSKLNALAKILESVPEPSKLPLAPLLRARLAQLRSEPERALELFERLLRELADFDGLREEAAEVYARLGLEKEVEPALQKARGLGSRNADVYYDLAKLAAQDEYMEAAEGHFRTAWQLEPMNRERLFDNSTLASLAARPSLYESLELGSFAEPVVASTAERQPLEFPETAELVLLGEELTITLGEADIKVPGGAALAPEETPSEDAATRSERLEQEVLERLESAEAEELDVGALAQPRRRADLALAVVALAGQKRWDDLLDLTAGAGQHLEQWPPILIKLRVHALMETKKTDEARSLLVKLAQSDIGNSRRDPTTFFQLGELLAELGDYDRAIKAHRKAASISPRKWSDARIRQLQMEKDLASSYQEFRSKNFDIRYPRATDEKYARNLSLVLEAELERLKTWIPYRSKKRIEVHLFPLGEFMNAFSGGGAIIAFYDGRVRVPFADFESLHPIIIAILSHEVAHAMIDSYTDDQAPRWLHEGLAQHVQMVPDFVNPIPDLHRTNRILSFPVIEMVLSGFGDPQLVELAYSEATWLVHYLETRYGAAGIRRLLGAYAKGLDTERAVRRAFKISTRELERQAWDWCLKKAPAAWEVESRRYDDEFSPLLQRSDGKLAAAPVPRATRQQARPISTKDAMAAWHPTYAARTRPVKAALGEVIGIFRKGGGGDSRAACGRLRDELSVLLRNSQTLDAPDPQAAKYLREAYRGFMSMASVCQQGEDSRVRREMKKAEKSLAIAATVLSKYGLRP